MKIELLEYKLINYKYDIYLGDKKDSRGRGSVLITTKIAIDTSTIDDIIMMDINSRLKLNDNYTIKIADKEIINKNIYNIEESNNQNTLNNFIKNNPLTLIGCGIILTCSLIYYKYL